MIKNFISDVMTCDSKNTVSRSVFTMGLPYSRGHFYTFGILSVQVIFTFNEIVFVTL